MIENKIKYVKAFGYMKDIVKSKAHPGKYDILHVKQSPVNASALHCKPWMESQKLGFEIPYGFKTNIEIIFDGNGSFEVINIKRLTKETGSDVIVDQFGSGFIGLNTGYAFETSETWNLYLCDITNDKKRPKLVSGVIESEWYPKTIFVVIKMPMKPLTWKLSTGDILCKIIPMIKGYKHKVVKMNTESFEGFKTRAQKYSKDERMKENIWTDGNGKIFTNVYKKWFRKFE